MLGTYQQRLSEAVAAPGVMLNTDETDFVKKEHDSVGVVTDLKLAPDEKRGDRYIISNSETTTCPSVYFP
ncbi:MAG: hypothetical protein QMC95_10195 [Desulfitobacteriaceae bacterium]|nr:hypothetical protein [Desulfitobacteriaceae bacterium]MDI6878308.1 hypothetical protein [Desulfitobacteriaceae bacterium]MDI6914580.1 hypothetical protein [Desulfitobacteriaceae bacterium]